jgi:peptidase C39-like protein
MTTDLFVAVHGLDRALLTRAVPPACLRSVETAPPPVREGAQVVIALPAWTPRLRATHLLPSFAPLTDAAVAFRFELSARVAGQWSPWVATVTIGVADFPPLPPAAGPLTCDVDVFKAAPAVEAVRLRVRARGDVGARWLAALSAADGESASVRAIAGAVERMRVPAFSQMEADPKLGARICSPTSVAMVLGYWDRVVAPTTIAAEVFHAGLDLYGVWPAAVRAAAARGVAGYLLRFPDWAAARWCLEHDIPIVASVRYAAGELTDAAIAATSGHLLVLVGWDDGHVLVNDPAAPSAGGVARRYRADELGRAWLARSGVGYVLFDPTRL